ncbi:hypothetical protein MtrunA17_Chr6g0487341 [Medicago truncatula]|uniref:Transmembrane protein n=1 Tax=Medicago truncatula TaxID=3880 RepID=A0A396HI99_MEDTR|nr:hypothetical protein MtrunA17_Chr6g0487341 [Medicago truncatula]
MFLGTSKTNEGISSLQHYISLLLRNFSCFGCLLWSFSRNSAMKLELWSQYFSLTFSQYFSLTFSQYFSLTCSQYFSLTFSQYFSLTFSNGIKNILLQILLLF